MLFMNQWDVAEAMDALDTPETPNLAHGAQALNNLVRWTNRNSDGWAYWPKPCRAAKRLQEVLQVAMSQTYRGGEVQDISAAELKKALTPIKAFLTRQGVESMVVLGG